MDMNSPITRLGGVGAKRAENYKKLGITTIGELLEHFPKSYIDFSMPVSIAEAPINDHAVIKALIIQKMPAARIRQGLVLYKIIAEDGCGDRLTLIYYNNQYVYNEIELGREYIFCGKVSGNFIRKEMNTPQFVAADAPCLQKPVYRLTEGITANMIRANIKTALENIDSSAFIDPVPNFIRQNYSLAAYEYSMRNIHFPSDAQAAALSKKRLAFDELLFLQLGMLMMKYRSRTEAGYPMTPNRDQLNKFALSLPFTLTNAQITAIKEITGDMCRGYPMNRLIQGDVGSGKTAVAAAAAYFAYVNHCQTALMAPTEILANQHFKTLNELLSPLGVRVCCLTGSIPAAKRKLLNKQIADGEFDIITGTHALISETTEFKSLGLVIMDEQHRFGVNQRAKLAEKGNNPHRLVMSATPIPRTLAMIIYGDLDISVLNELPKGRQVTETYAVTAKMRERAFGFVKKLIDEGRQAYIVCPMIEDGGNELAAAENYAARLSENDFKGYTIGLLHGKMSAAEKDDAMARFKDGTVQLLVATTVVEVGVDVPNAAVILIENAERFGLSQLHQLRGRVGRGKYKSYCILIAGTVNDDIRKRLKIMTETTDGFKISEYDLELRGAGDFFGERQHGLPETKILDALSDREVISAAQSAAKDIYDESPDLEKFPLLKCAVEKLFMSGTAEAL